MNKPKGLAAVDKKIRLRISSAGGKAVSANREHMAEIGRKGGLAVSKDRKFMAAIGRVGGSRPRVKAENVQ